MNTTKTAQTINSQNPSTHSAAQFHAAEVSARAICPEPDCNLSHAYGRHISETRELAESHNKIDRLGRLLTDQAPELSTSTTRAK